MKMLGTDIIKQYGIVDCAQCRQSLAFVGWQSVSVPQRDKPPRALCFFCALEENAESDEPDRIPPALRA